MTGYILTERQERQLKYVGSITAQRFSAWFRLAYPMTKLKLPDNFGDHLGETLAEVIKEEFQWYRFEPLGIPEEHYHVGTNTMAQVFEPAGLTNVNDLQAVFDAVEKALTPAPQTREVGSS
jgi:hypothetical protein